MEWNNHILFVWIKLHWRKLLNNHHIFFLSSISTYLLVQKQKYLSYTRDFSFERWIKMYTVKWQIKRAVVGKDIFLICRKLEFRLEFTKLLMLVIAWHKGKNIAHSVWIEFTAQEMKYETNFLFIVTDSLLFIDFSLAQTTKKIVYSMM